MVNEELLKEYCILIHKKDREIEIRNGEDIGEDNSSVYSVEYISELDEYLEIDITYKITNLSSEDSFLITYETQKCYIFKRYYDEFIISKRKDKINKIKCIIKEI